MLRISSRSSLDAGGGSCRKMMMIIIAILTYTTFLPWRGTNLRWDDLRRSAKGYPTSCITKHLIDDSSSPAASPHLAFTADEIHPRVMKGKTYWRCDLWRYVSCTSCSGGFLGDLELAETPNGSSFLRSLSWDCGLEGAKVVHHGQADWPGSSLGSIDHSDRPRMDRSGTVQCVDEFLERD